MKDIMETTKSQYRLLMAHPEANGFLGAKFPAGGIPHAYTSIAKMFFNQVGKLEQQTNLREVSLCPGVLAKKIFLKEGTVKIKIKKQSSSAF